MIFLENEYGEGNLKNVEIAFQENSNPYNTTMTWYLLWGILG
jgi:hypothetical protein